MRFSRDQVTLEGASVTEEQMRAALLGTPNTPVACPFCWAKQMMRAMRLFNPEGKLLKMLKCAECGRKMQASSVEAPRGDSWNFGLWVGYYERFWQSVDHDAWIAGLKAFYLNDQKSLSRFWDGYGEVRPKFKERRDAERQTREYERQWAKEPTPEQEEETE